MDSRAKELIRQGDAFFSKRQTLNSLWQETADNFYVERADFTRIRTLGTDFTAHLLTSYPLMVRRDLGNALSAMLRPRGEQWFSTATQREDLEDQQAKVWLEWASGVQWRAMYDRSSQFVRATKEGDQDFATFGQTVLSVELNKTRDTLLYRCWHLRDVVWAERYDGSIGTVHRKWKPFACDFVAEFGGQRGVTIDPKMSELAGKEPYKEVEIRHIVVETENYNKTSGATGKKFNTPWVSIFIDVSNECVVQEVGVHSRMYVIPRWQTVSGSQYSFSPATVCALPDARLIQAMSRTLLEAGEKAVNPPMLMVKNAVRSDINVYAGGVTVVDAVMDGKLQEVLAPINQDFRGLPHGVEMQADIREMLKEAFFLNKLTLPQTGGEMTAYETAQRVQEYIRQALPLFEPMEDEYNAAICEETFNLMMRNGAFGAMADIPQSLRGQEIQFKFKSPLSQATGAEKGVKFQQAGQLIAEATQLNPDAGTNVDAVTALRDALEGIGMPAKWMRSTDDAQALAQQNQQARAHQQTIANAGPVTDAAKSAAQAAALLSQNGQGAPAT